MLWSLATICGRNRQKKAPEPRVSNPIALNYAKALASRYIRVHRVLDFYSQPAIEKCPYRRRSLIGLYSIPKKIFDFFYPAPRRGDARGI